MALKGRRSRLFRRKPDMLLIDERLSTIVLPVLPTDHVFVDDEEDELLYAEEAENVAMESEPAAPLRVFLGANVDSDNDETDPVISSAWDLSSLVDDEDEDFSAPPASPPPLKPRIGGLATLSTATLPVEEGESIVGSGLQPVAESNAVETKRRPALATLSVASMPIEEDDSSWEMPDVASSETPLADEQLPDFKPSPGLATLSSASLAVEEPAGLSLDEVDPQTPVRELATKGTSFFDSEFENAAANIRIAPISSHSSDMDDFDYDDDDYSESEIEDTDDFYSSPKPIAPSAVELNPEPFLRPQNEDGINRKSNLLISFIMVLLFIATLWLVIEAFGK